MYLGWNAKNLAEKLKTGTVSAGEKFFYLYVFWLLFPLYMGIDGLNLEVSLSLKMLNILPIIIYAIGIKQCLATNLSGDGKDFFERIICLSLPLGIQAYILSVILYTVFLFIFFSSSYESNAYRYTIEVLTRSFALLIFFERLKSYISDISGAKDRNTITNTPNL